MSWKSSILRPRENNSCIHMLILRQAYSSAVTKKLFVVSMVEWLFLHLLFPVVFNNFCAFIPKINSIETLLYNVSKGSGHRGSFRGPKEVEIERGDAEWNCNFAATIANRPSSSHALWRRETHRPVGHSQVAFVCGCDINFYSKHSESGWEKERVSQLRSFCRFRSISQSISSSRKHRVGQGFVFPCLFQTFGKNGFLAWLVAGKFLLACFVVLQVLHAPGLAAL